MTDKRARKEIIEMCYKLRKPEMADAQTDDIKSYELIKRFRTLYNDCKPDKSYDGCTRHYNFFRQLFPIWEALINKNYVLALHEIETITAYNNIFQLRIKTALGDLLNQYVNSSALEKRKREKINRKIKIPYKCDFGSYDETLGIVRSFLRIDETKEEVQLFLNYVIEIIKRDIETSTSFFDEKFSGNNAVKDAVYNPERAFKYFDTDGRYWYFKKEFLPPEEVVDFRYALFFQIKKMLYKTDNMQES